MTQSTDPGPAIAVPSKDDVPRVADVANVPSTATPGQSQRVLFVACGLPISLLVAAAITFVIVHVNKMRKDSSQPSDTGFCCPDEARELVMSVNRRTSPCVDFFAYVCSNVISDELLVEAALQPQLRFNLSCRKPS